MKEHSLPRIAPFALYMLFIGVEGGLRYFDKQGLVSLSDLALHSLYPVKVLLVSCALIFYWRKYSEISFRDLLDLKKSLLSLTVGLLVFFLWINMDWLLPGQDAPLGFDPNVFAEGLTRQSIIWTRIAGAALIVPIMEEIFWRSFLLRYIIKSEFWTVLIGQFTWGSFVICAVLFGLEHHFILAGIMAGVFYTLLLYKTKSIAQCILGHAITNCALGLYVLLTGKWYFW